MFFAVLVWQCKIGGFCSCAQHGFTSLRVCAYLLWLLSALTAHCGIALVSQRYNRALPIVDRCAVFFSLHRPQDALAKNARNFINAPVGAKNFDRCASSQQAPYRSLSRTAQRLIHFAAAPLPKKSDDFPGALLFFLPRPPDAEGVHSPKSGVEKYLSAVSGSTVTTVLPSPSCLASFNAAATLVPLDMPHMSPS